MTLTMRCNATTTNYKLFMDDSVVKAVVESYQKRSEQGVKKYGVTLDRNDSSFTEWINNNFEIVLLDLLFRYDNKEISKKEFIDQILNYV